MTKMNISNEEQMDPVCPKPDDIVSPTWLFCQSNEEPQNEEHSIKKGRRQKTVFFKNMSCQCHKRQRWLWQ